MGSRDYLGSLLEIFGTSERKVDVVSPFIDEEGSQQLVAWSGQSRALVRIFTRKAEPALVAAGENRGWEIYNYRGTPHRDEDRGFHCKFFLGDGRTAVLGSANLIYHNMLENLELGFYTTDPRHTAALRDVVSSLRRASVRVVGNR